MGDGEEDNIKLNSNLIASKGGSFLGSNKNILLYSYVVSTMILLHFTTLLSYTSGSRCLVYHYITLQYITVQYNTQQ